MLIPQDLLRPVPVFGNLWWFFFGIPPHIIAQDQSLEHMMALSTAIHEVILLSNQQ